MSLFSFLTKVWDEVKSLFGGLPAELKIAVDVGVKVTEGLKTFVDSPEADILTAIIPGTVDDALKNLLRAKLPVILSDMKLVDATLGLTDPNAITAAAIKVIQSLDPSISNAFLHNISILVAQVAADGKLSWSDGVYILEWYYKNVFQTPAAA